MELPRRTAGDALLRSGELLRLRQIARRHDLTSVITCAFDHRTRMLPFVYPATRMAPAGVRAIGSHSPPYAIGNGKNSEPLTASCNMRIAGRMISKEGALSPVPSTTVQRFATAVGVRYELTGVRA
jgi:hypothetical protein